MADEEKPKLVALKTNAEIDTETMLRMLDEARAKVIAGKLRGMVITTMDVDGTVGDSTCFPSTVEVLGALSLVVAARQKRYLEQGLTDTERF